VMIRFEEQQGHVIKYTCAVMAAVTHVTELDIGQW